ncbi:hypothetical protein AGABI1DRAFT_76491 [Agaricus bisporus var. burnettii JB137-S8]|uniref:Choline/carnitine acyltransferase domain-containing protein n=1 Tax=Agaricus bisporus var. burnettii (strain JB137-S8 / ATCC MYA-4627 / FGSC 10392) TaxID=597362 RepID=K5VUI5_AGABU|nr:uncharacterized protein AGABI1DRAFT_76491 [Agaricus bisporus var. burnettii JB137-S8]EKM78099.1 hypothetical protein AGABI1DRAFT_76491 [Agaricus bisporus var. burnettii JB137-S8]
MRWLMRSKSYSSLPRLPVPDLHKTLDRYLISIQPFLHDSEPSFSAAYQLRKQWADDFHSGIGSVLQERLLALDKVSPNNWLDDNFWIQKAYHEWRTPLVVNSNWWLAFYDDNLIPQNSRTVSQPEKDMAGATTWQLRRAAWLIHRTLEFVDNLHGQESEPQPDTTRTGIWLRDSTSKMFNIARIPQPGCDTLSIPPPQPHSLAARSILVMFHNFCYTIPVYSPIGELASPNDIYRRLRRVVVDTGKRIKSGEQAFLIGVLSSDDRDMWAKNLSYLLSLSPENKSSHDRLLASVMAVSLDHESYELSPASTSSHPRSDTQSTLDSHLHSIRSTPSNFSNRFFDKPYTLLVDPLARAGATGEHSPCDALVPSIVAEYSIVQGVEEEAFDSAEVPEAATRINDEDGFIPINWVADNKLWNECHEAKRRSVAVIQDSDYSVFWFDDYGSDWIKNSAKLSPDAYIQMALQLAWYRTRNSFTATYETVLTRMFKRGRTETLRSYTNDSRTWILAMSDSHLPVQQQYELLKKAVSTHTNLTRQAATGRGIDRHLLGLRLMLKPSDPEPPLFTDPLFLQSQEWKLSTSGLSAGHWFKGTGFGSQFNDGYGINYLAAPGMIKFGIESKFSSSSSSTYLFKNAIADALKEMRGICQAGMVPIEEHPIRTHL